MDSAWEQDAKRLEATQSEMLDAKRPTCRSVAKVCIIILVLVQDALLGVFLFSLKNLCFFLKSQIEPFQKNS